MPLPMFNESVSQSFFSFALSAHIYVKRHNGTAYSRLFLQSGKLLHSFGRDFQRACAKVAEIGSPDLPLNLRASSRLWPYSITATWSTTFFLLKTRSQTKSQEWNLGITDYPSNYTRCQRSIRRTWKSKL